MTSLKLLHDGHIPDMIENALFPSLKVIIFDSPHSELKQEIVDLLRSRHTPSNNLAAIECIRYTLATNKKPMSLYSFSDEIVQVLRELGVRIESVIEQP